MGSYFGPESLEDGLALAVWCDLLRRKGFQRFSDRNPMAETRSPFEKLLLAAEKTLVAQLRLGKLANMVRDCMERLWMRLW